MAHFQIEWLIIEWPTKLNGLLLNGPPNRMGHHWVIHFHYRVAHRASSVGPNARNLVYTRRLLIAVYPRIQNSYVFGFPSGARDWGKSHGIPFWLGRGPKIISCSRQKIVINSRSWGCGWWRKVFIFFFLKHWNEAKFIDRDPRSKRQFS